MTIPLFMIPFISFVLGYCWLLPERSLEQPGRALDDLLGATTNDLTAAACLTGLYVGYIFDLFHSTCSFSEL